ncbi:MAG: hypothetical protein ACI97B_003414 [Verrucomicrobiales bacterium]|jgi:hypothetical protein
MLGDLFNRSARFLCAVLAGTSLSAGEPLRFNQDIRPILSDHCFACHGFDAKKRKADLRLDVAESAFADHDGVRAIVPGKVEESALWERIQSSDDDDIMPPPDFHKPLSPTEKATLKQWIGEGAPYEAHWAFVKPRKADVPQRPGVIHSIDAFLQARLEREGLAPAPPADRETLIRRATLDLTGLPPTLAEIDAFLADTRPDAWSRLIDELMTRPTYGEHMARYWLDLARYADTHGMHLDNKRSMWPYRDWVVRAYNKNLPFDEFTRWQLAGDLLPEPTLDQRVASGFNRCNVTTGEGGSINEEWIYRYAVDRTSTAAEVWMGLTAGCAVCHDHKFDPLSTREFYSLYAFFNSAADPAMDGNREDTPPILHIPREEDESRIKELDAQVVAIDKRIAETVGNIVYEDPAEQNPLPPPQTTETIWFDDGFPSDGSLSTTGPAIQLTNAEQGPVYRGALALTRIAENITGQDVYQEGPARIIPQDAVFFVYAYLDPDNPPESIMLQWHVKGWSHRAAWGAHDKIGWGKPKTHERVDMGPLPKTGEWVRLEVPAKDVGLTAGTKVTGFALTQFSGKMHWDHFGFTSTVEKAADPQWSWTLWKQQNAGKNVKSLPEDLRKWVKSHRVETWTDEQHQKLYSHWLEHTYAGSRAILASLVSEKAPIAEEKNKIEKNTPYTFVMADLPKPRESFVMIRGQYDKPGEKVHRITPAFLPPMAERPADRDYNRLDLANWLVNKEHPLTARVAVNRLWQQFFGTGLVKTSADFGSQGAPPSHPELLDWLACQFMEDGWDVQAFVKHLLTSHAYRQNASANPELLNRDPENRLLARGPRIRLDAEILRDQALYMSGLLVPTIGGPGVRPYQPPNIWEPVAFGGSNTRYYKQDSGEGLYRRSLYTFFKRTAPPPFMSTFDAPNREQSCAGRGRSNTPLQALQLMNDIQHVEAARNFAQRILNESGETDDQRLSWAWRTVSGRMPAEDEVEVVRGLLHEQKTRYAADAESAKALIAYGESKPDPALDPVELASWTLVANLLFNLDEVVSKN